MNLVGLTGGIGSGKSTVAKMLSELGATVVDADQLARAAVAKGSQGLAAIVAEFGPQMLDSQGHLDRKRLGRQVFKDESARRKLEAMLHPVVAQMAQDRFAEAHACGAPLVVYDVPLLYEKGLDQVVAQVVVVSVSGETQRARVLKRDDLPTDEIEDRIAAQMPIADKVARADHVIDNDGSVQSTQAQVQALYAKLTQETAP